MLELNDVSIVVGGRRRLSALSLLLADGQSLLFTGGDETVRSALMQALLGMKPVAGGHVLIDGERVTPMSAPCFRSRRPGCPHLDNGQTRPCMIWWTDCAGCTIMLPQLRLKTHCAKRGKQWAWKLVLPISG